MTQGRRTSDRHRIRRLWQYQRIHAPPCTPLHTGRVQWANWITSSGEARLAELSCSLATRHDHRRQVFDTPLAVVTAGHAT